MIKPFLVLILFVLTGCSSSVKTIFGEQEEYDPLDNIKLNKSIADKFKTVEPPKEKNKVIPKKKMPVKVAKKKVIIPAEFREKFLAMDNNSKKVWDQYNLNLKIEEEIIIKIYFFGLTVGHLKMSVRPMVKIGDRLAYHFSARMKSAKYYSYFYSLDNSVDSYLDYKTRTPLKFLVLQRESKQKVDDLQLFDIEKRKTFVWYKRTKKNKNKEFNREAYIPEFFMDILSSFYFTRGLPMIPGNQYTIPIISRAKTYMFNMEVLKQENVKANRKNYPAYKIRATSIGENKEKKGEVFFWYSTEPNRKLLKFAAKVKIGEIRGELIDYRAGKKLNLSNASRKELRNVSQTIDY
ncbi:MAG: hypothetical protein DRQ88_05735 [Epsilonproteobacteria bacterium]|nr:MAG: hypothetical protein DRQ89_07030 [Campylobacterota bacterium]RLA66714.1 MAG: hypothetical protein DRQ88_05735 [Campylobacterota bacterium]